MMILIVAGGASRRFGRDKRLFPIGGIPLLCRTIAVAATAGLPITVAIASRPGRLPRPEGVTFWLDREPGAGPLPVVVDALDRRQDDVLCLASDLVNLEAEMLHRLLEAAGRTRKDVVTFGDARRWQPLCAVYTTRCRTWLTAAAQGGERSLHHVLRARADAVEILPLPIPWTNLNEPADRGAIT